MDEETVIRTYTNDGWRIVSRGATGIQFIRPRRVNGPALIVVVFVPLLGGIVWTPLWIIALIGAVAVTADYIGRADELCYVSFD